MPGSNQLSLPITGFSALNSSTNLMTGPWSGGNNVQTDGTPARVYDNLDALIDSAISTIRSHASLLGGNVTFLQSRIDFTSNYINTLQEGSGKLTLADLNEEGADLVSLQTRQQIGVQSLSITGQQQQAILNLLR